MTPESVVIIAQRALETTALIAAPMLRTDRAARFEGVLDLR